MQRPVSCIKVKAVEDSVCGDPLPNFHHIFIFDENVNSGSEPSAYVATITAFFMSSVLIQSGGDSAWNKFR
jgi:hypothetical protein